MNSLTGVVSSSRDALEMLWWSAGVFELELSGADGDGSKQGFALIAFAQSSANLHHWVSQEHFASQTAPTTKHERSLFFRDLMDRIVWSHELRAISEAARHAKDSSTYWTGSNVPRLRGDAGRIEELDSTDGQQSWFQSLMRGLTDGSLWFENILQDDKKETDARRVIIEHCSAWDNELGALRGE